MRDADGLVASSKGKRRRFSGDQPSVIEGRFSQNQGADGRLLALASALHGRSLRMAETRPLSMEEQRLKSDPCLMPVISVRIPRLNSRLYSSARRRKTQPGIKNRNFRCRISAG